MKNGILFLVCAALAQNVAGHIAFWHPSMYGFNQSEGDNRPVDPLANLTFDKWWFHDHLAYPPNAGDVFNLPAGGSITSQLTCHKGYTSWNASSGGPIDNKGQPDSPCPGSPSTQWHAENAGDVEGCALAIAQKSDAKKVNPEDFVIFSANHTCVWNKFTDFAVPAQMPACPKGGCTCAFFWIHAPDSGAPQIYMNGFHCDVTGAKPDAPALAKSQVAKRCGHDPATGRSGNPNNCTIGAKQPLYWYQKERNNMFEGPLDPPVYNDLYGFKDGAQDDIFESAQGKQLINSNTSSAGAINGSGVLTSPSSDTTQSSSSISLAPDSAMPSDVPLSPTPAPSNSTDSANSTSAPSACSPGSSRMVKHHTKRPKSYRAQSASQSADRTRQTPHRHGHDYQSGHKCINYH
ncbi:hypothetical protein D9756_003021 [Leucocoprinus leucothites]|uniref:Lytic polysaccharide monooxygenase n=1 Tax=Leucocoprinus leucothites TaxID=201217 RepID=A0A8H5LJT4_9AGAR|nr:hypothetical protein D9756_003021 [Leucoagaricus leucothites]